MNTYKISGDTYSIRVNLKKLLADKIFTKLTWMKDEKIWEVESELSNDEIKEKISEEIMKHITVE